MGVDKFTAAATVFVKGRTARAAALTVSECVPRGVLFMLFQERRLWTLRTCTAENREVWTAVQMTASLKYSNHS